jgi:hypothetical protein
VLVEALGLWKPAPTHPAILALAIKQLMAAKVYERGQPFIVRRSTNTGQYALELPERLARWAYVYRKLRPY